MGLEAALSYESLDGDFAIPGGGWIGWRMLLHLYWYIAIPGCDTISAFSNLEFFSCATLLFTQPLLKTRLPAAHGRF